MNLSLCGGQEGEFAHKKCLIINYLKVVIDQALYVCLSDTTKNAAE